MLKIISVLKGLGQLLKNNNYNRKIEPSLILNYQRYHFKTLTIVKFRNKRDEITIFPRIQITKKHKLECIFVAIFGKIFRKQENHEKNAINCVGFECDDITICAGRYSGEVYRV